jgi:hypothetical protein
MQGMKEEKEKEIEEQHTAEENIESKQRRRKK